MGWGDTDYATVGQVKAMLGINDVVDDPALGLAVTAASRAIDHHCRRQFGVLTTTAPRVYDAPRSRYDDAPGLIIQTDDFQSATGLVVTTAPAAGEAYDTTLTIDVDFECDPVNAAADSRPWTGLRVFTPTYGFRFRVEALFGWTVVPDAIQEACLVQALRFFKRKDSPFGVAGSPEAGGEMRLLARVDPDVQVLLQPYRSWLRRF